ncbi:LacI family DNA-binding transcriptional regulator [Phenylobacterium montanum]|uniref:LacI family DNA-binding transcriptional regulator n=1 Tax=Phenylobacterium montanum TaxID=2823693 RepID=A0A975G294_9CAUL|nr:LacI family DNA-binding transcriptional regulator [Caulobacter sp. S6]QUD89803.1 LacI family DNA-binding transcriptional regulator [Caulobacter sp. S6]
MTRRPTISDVAEAAGVSIKSVSRVVNGEPHVSARMRQRVNAAVNALNFQMSSQAHDPRARAAGRSLVVAQLYGDRGGHYTNAVQIGLLSRCHHYGYHLVVEELDYKSAQFERRARALVEHLQLAGAVLTAPVTESDIIQGVLEQAGVPFVCISPLKEAAHAPSVRIDERRAASQITQHLLAYGHRRIGFIRGLANHAATHLRQQGFEDAMKAAGIAPDPQLIENGDFSYATASICAERLLRRPDRPTAIFASNDEMAAAVIKVAHELGLSLPDQLSVVGFDDMPGSDMLWPPLTTVRQNAVALGEAAGDLLFAQLLAELDPAPPQPPARQILSHDIVLRSSTAICRSSNPAAPDDPTRQQ